MNKIGISLGMTCDAAVWGINNDLRERKINGYKTCPFDEMLSNYPGVVECLKDDFKYFCDTNYLTIVDTTDGPFIFNSKYKFAFNHESPGHDNLHIKQQWNEGINHFINNNFTNFIERYNKRINSFREYLANPNNYINFLIERYNTFKVDLWELKDALLLHYPNLKFNFNIIFIDNISARKVLQTLQFSDEDEEINRLDYWMDSPNFFYNNFQISYNNLQKKAERQQNLMLEQIFAKISNLENKINDFHNIYNIHTTNTNTNTNNTNFKVICVDSETQTQEQEQEQKQEEKMPRFQTQSKIQIQVQDQYHNDIQNQNQGESGTKKIFHFKPQRV